MYLKPIVNFQFIVPTTVHLNHGKKCNVYKFYNGTDFQEYLTNEKQHPVDKTKAYTEFDQYLSRHQTKEIDLDAANHIWTTTNKPKKATGKADNTIIYHCFISLDEMTTSLGGFENNRTKKRVCDQFFFQLMKHHNYNPADWCYMAAEHTNTKHTHLHVLVYQPNTVAKSHIVDWTKKENCMTSRWVRTNTTRFIEAVIGNIRDGHVERAYELKRLHQAIFKDEIKKDTFKDAIKELAREIGDVKGFEGRLQYNHILKYSQLTQKEEKKLSASKEEWIPVQQAKILINKIDALTDYVIKSKPDFLKSIKEAEKELNRDFDTDSPNLSPLVKYRNQKFKNEYHRELYAYFGNRILQTVKDNVYGTMWVMSKDYRIQYNNFPEDFQWKRFRVAKDCRSYVFNLIEAINYAGKQLEKDFFQMLKSAKYSDLENCAHSLRAEEEMMMDLKKEEKEEETKKKHVTQLSM